MHYKNGNTKLSTLRSNAFIPTRHVLSPVLPGMILTLNLHRHSWHIIGGPNSSLIAAFTNYGCAVSTAEELAFNGLDHLSDLERLTFISQMRIIDTKSEIQWRLAGKEWVPTNEPTN